MGLLQPPDAAHELDLHIEGQTRRDSVRIELVGGEPFGLEKNLVTLFVGIAMDLVLDRRAIAGADPLDHSGVHRRAIQAPADDFVRARIGVGDPAGQLARMHPRRSDKRKDGNRLVARLRLQDRKIDGAAVEPGGRPGLEATHWKLELAQSRSEAD